MPFQPSYDVPEDRQPYYFQRGRTGCLILHGFMGSPKSSRPLAQYLAEQDISSRCPLLPGHGHYPDKLYKVPRQAWIDEAEEAYQVLRRHCDQIFMIGHSMGTVLSAYLAIKCEGVRGVVMLAPAYEMPDKRLYWMKYLRYVMPWFYPLKSRSLRDLVHERVLDFDPTLDLDDPEVQARLPMLSRVPTSGLDEMRKMSDWGRELWPRLNVPVLILQGGRDRAVSPGNADHVYALLPHPENQLRKFPQAGHELMRPFDPAHHEVWRLIRAFINQRVPVKQP